MGRRFLQKGAMVGGRGSALGTRSTRDLTWYKVPGEVAGAAPMSFNLTANDGLTVHQKEVGGKS